MTHLLISEILERCSRENIDLNWYAGKRILVTGGAGFIGSWLVEALVKLGADVYVVDNLWRGSLENLITEDGTPQIPFNDHFFQDDLQDYQAALSACRRSNPDVVFHLADIVAGIDFVFANEAFVFRANNLINSNVFTAAKETGVRRLVYLGTACSYPKALQTTAKRMPLVEKQVYPAEPESAYGWSKLMGEYEAELTAKGSDMQLGILRLQNVYGPRAILSKSRSQVIPSLIRKAVRYPEEEFVVWGSGKQARDFVFVGDVIDAILRLVLKGMGQGPIQIGTAHETTVADLASMIVAISGKRIQIKFDQDKPEGDGGRSGNFDKARQVLGWGVFTPLEDGLKRTYDWAFDQVKSHKAAFD